jgi:hypothetical protein
MIKKPKATPLDLLRSARDQARSGQTRGVVSERTIQAKGRYARAAARGGRAITSPAAYVQSMIGGIGTPLQTTVGGPYVGPFRFRPNSTRGYRRNDED